MEAVDNAVIEIGHNTLIGYCPSYSPVIEIGDNKKEYSHIKIGKIDLLDICKRLEKLEEENDELREKLNALWYATSICCSQQREVRISIMELKFHN